MTTLDRETMRKVRQLASEGMTVSEIDRELGIGDYWTVWAHIPESTWRGARVKITNRLNRLIHEKDPDKRRVIVEAVQGYIDRFYYEGQYLGRVIQSIRKAIR